MWVGVWGREFVDFSVIIVPLQLPDDTTECKVNKDCVPGYVDIHSSGKNLLQRLLSVCVVIAPCCAFPLVQEAAFRFGLLVLILS